MTFRLTLSVMYCIILYYAIVAEVRQAFPTESVAAVRQHIRQKLSNSVKILKNRGRMQDAGSEATVTG